MRSYSFHNYVRFYSPACCIALTIAALAPVAAFATVVADVPLADRKYYEKIYQFTPTANQNWNAATSYSVNNSGMTLAAGFSRIAYYLELQDATNPRQWVWVSMNAFTTDLTKIGVPTTATGVDRNFSNTTISNMTVRSNVGGIVTGTGISTGNIEFWPNDYGGANVHTVPNATGAYDFGDSESVTNPGYGSMQIHNYDLDGLGAGTTGQTLFSYSGWGGYTGDLGIGTNTGPGQLDWTLIGNAASYTLIRNFEIWVLDTAQALVPEPSTFTLLGMGAIGLAVRTRRRRRTAV